MNEPVAVMIPAAINKESSVSSPAGSIGIKEARLTKNGQSHLTIMVVIPPTPIDEAKNESIALKLRENLSLNVRPRFFGKSTDMPVNRPIAAKEP